MTKRVLILMSDTGGGHRAAAEAIRDALKRQHGTAVEVELVDVFRQYSPFPLKYAPETYPMIVNNAVWAWRLAYKIAAERRQTVKFFSARNYRTMKNGLQRMLRERPADVVVSVHSILTIPSLHAYAAQPKRPPFLIVVTDLVTTPMFWYDPRAERCFVPTEAAYALAIQAGFKPEQVRLTGLPVNPRFAEMLPEKRAAREALGWHPDLPAILMISGGDGMGPVYETARAINDLAMPCQLAVVAGRNKPLKRRLDNSTWNQPTYIYPFVRQIPQLMAAADILVTKAGPATLMEACIAGLPMILSDCIPGQEEGNVTHIVEHDAGVFAPKPALVAQAVAAWLSEGTAGINRRAANASRLAHPNAVWEIAEEVWQFANQPAIQNSVRR